MNYENFCKVLAKIEANPSCWDQTSFYCNCFAGIAAEMAGCKSGDPTDRHMAADAFLGITRDWLFSHGLYAVGNTLAHFQRIRHVMATHRLMARMA